MANAIQVRRFPCSGWGAVYREADPLSTYGGGGGGPGGGGPGGGGGGGGGGGAAAAITNTELC